MISDWSPPSGETPSTAKLPVITLPVLLSVDRGPIAEVRTESLRRFPRLRIVFKDHGELARPYEITSQAEADFCFDLILKYVQYDLIRYLFFLTYFNIEFGIRYSKGILIERAVKKTYIPTIAPEVWPGKWRSEVDVDVFFRRVWGSYLQNGLTMAHLRRLDLSLYYAINKFERAHKRPWPSDLTIPTERSKLAEAMAKLHSEGANGLTANEVLAVGRKLVRNNRNKNLSFN